MSARGHGLVAVSHRGPLLAIHYVNGTLAIQATDSTFTNGKSGLLTFKSAAQFKGVRAYQP